MSLCEVPEFLGVLNLSAEGKIAEKMMLRLIVNLLGHKYGRSYLLACPDLLIRSFSNISDETYSQEEINLLYEKYNIVSNYQIVAT